MPPYYLDTDGFRFVDSKHYWTDFTLLISVSKIDPMSKIQFSFIKLKIQSWQAKRKDIRSIYMTTSSFYILSSSNISYVRRTSKHFYKALKIICRLQIHLTAFITKIQYMFDVFISHSKGYPLAFLYRVKIFGKSQQTQDIYFIICGLMINYFMYGKINDQLLYVW